jgi:hypothetical protein
MEERDILDNPDKTAGHTYAAVTGEHPGRHRAGERADPSLVSGGA